MLLIAGKKAISVMLIAPSLAGFISSRSKNRIRGMAY